MQEQTPSPRVAHEIARLDKEMETFTQEKLYYEAQILRVRWMITSTGTTILSVTGGLPLPQSCPMEFACMPEHFVEDVMELLIFASRIPCALDGVKLIPCTSTLFEGHQLSVHYLVKNLLKLYVDIGLKGSHTQVTVS
ncbi:hypothetical protein L2E82_25719 [Cichorium intybus]|uniref:Uncharacterized protein n=1 Tax=Cichorium intybus TaxID=13427 RepID=A0ACB9E3Z0_CICIN|nr:hypothetical protein L2E82_25719 [Cichorium intybus]